MQTSHTNNKGGGSNNKGSNTIDGSSSTTTTNNNNNNNNNLHQLHDVQRFQQMQAVQYRQNHLQQQQQPLGLTSTTGLGMNNTSSSSSQHMMDGGSMNMSTGGTTSYMNTGNNMNTMIPQSNDMNVSGMGHHQHMISSSSQQLQLPTMGNHHTNSRLGISTTTMNHGNTSTNSTGNSNHMMTGTTSGYNNNNNNSSSSNSFGGNWGNHMSSSQQQSNFHSSDAYGSVDGSLNNNMSGGGSGGGTNSLLMAMSGMVGSGIGNQQQQHHHMMSHSDSNANSASSSSALQNMQALLLKQQQQQQQQQQLHSRQSLQQQQQQQPFRPMGTPTIPSTSSSSSYGNTNLSQQYPSSNPMMGIQGGASYPNVAVSGNQQQQQQQLLLFQQQLAALQKQQQMSGTGGSNPIGTGNAVASNAAMVAMQQHMGSGLPNNNNNNNGIGLNSQVGHNTMSATLQQQQQQGVSQLSMLQARKNQLAQQMQQQQQLDLSTSDTTGSTSNIGNLQRIQNLRQISNMNPSMLMMMQQQQQQQQSNAGMVPGVVVDPHQPVQNNMNDNPMSMMNYQQQLGSIRNQGQFGNDGNMNKDIAALQSRSVQPQNQLFSGGSITDNNTLSSVTDQTSFLDGRFAGGWQSNADLPERRRVIFSILDVIRQMRPDTSKLSNKLPHMAKSLEEHLYRSAKSKEEYMDLSTLKNRLQSIAHGLEVHRSSDTVPTNQIKPHDAQIGGETQSVGQSSNWSLNGALRSNSSGVDGFISQMNPGQLSSAMQPLGTGYVDNTNASNVRTNLQSNISSGSYQGTSLHQQQGSIDQNDQWSLDQGSINAGKFVLSQSSEQEQSFQLHERNVGNSNAPTSYPQNNIVTDGTINSTLNQSRNYPDSISGNIDRHHKHSNSWGSFSRTTDPAIATEPVSSDLEYPASSKFQDPSTSQKMKVINQQQQRLLLLRHASKCTAGPQCTTKFCEQMVTLWKHMKTCRNKNCKTSHCLSSRCVLNHYRICKSNGRTLICEVCGPVMMKIKQQERDDGTNDDPLTRDQDPSPAEQFSSTVAPSLSTYPQPTADQSQLLQVQANQSKLKAQLDILKLLQQQQEELLEQQKNLEAQAQNVTDPNSAQFLQLQEQQLLLEQLQKRCQQQLLLVQQELQMQTAPSGDVRVQQYEPQPQLDSVESGTSDELVTAEKMLPLHHRPGNGGKRLGKSLVLPISRKSKEGTEQKAAKKVRASSTGKQKSVRSLEPTQPDPNRSVSTEESISVLTCMTPDEIQKHLESLNKRIVLSSRTVTHKCRPILQELLDDPFGWVFHDAVDPVALGLPDYFDVIKNPMHMDLIRKKVENAIYSDMESFARDMRLVFQNAILYNGESSEVGELAESMMSRFDKLYSDVVADIENSHLNLESQGELCSLCGVQKRRYEATIHYCQGKCGMQRIVLNTPYYTDKTKQNHWCEQCFHQLDSDKPICLDNGTEIMKNELQECKNDSVPEEGWANCDTCNSSVHQVCALYNGRTNKPSDRFKCPTCCIKAPASSENRERAEKVIKGSKDLPKCKLSDALEDGLYKALQSAYLARSNELGVTIDNVEKAEGLCVRVLSNVEKKTVVGEKMTKRYSTKGYPNEFPHRSKCIALFQKIHGVDTLLFAMYVYEFGDDCPAPNRRRVYISYLDSVRYFEPKCYRTIVYHSIIVEYLRHVKRRGFHTASIWSCPPVGGDDYIFYCHPKHQLVPREDMLRSWYHKMLDQAKAQGIVISTSTLYDEYFVPDSSDSVPCGPKDPTCLPYFEGDYIPGEIEIIIQQLEANGEATLETSSPDSVMVRLGHHLHKMKDNFIIVHLRSSRFVEAVQRGEDVSNWKEDSDDDMVRSKRAKISAKSTSESDSQKIHTSNTLSPALRTEQEVAVPPANLTDQEMSVVADIGQSAISTDQENVLVNDIEQKTISADESLTIGTVTLQSTISIDQDNNDGEDISQSAITLISAPEILEDERNNFDETNIDTKHHTLHGDSVSLEKIDNHHVDVVTTTEEVKIDTSGEEKDLALCQESHTASCTNVERADGSCPTISDTKTLDNSEFNSVQNESGVSPKLFENNVEVEDSMKSPTPHQITLSESGKSNDKTKNVSNDSTNGAHEIEMVAASETPTASLSMKSGVESFTLDVTSTEELTRKRLLDEIQPAIKMHFSGLNPSTAIVGDTVDEDPLIESGLFESRQQFLNYCQTTHCQFDELRRAKHSSVMVLFQLHNPTAPKFLEQSVPIREHNKRLKRQQQLMDDRRRQAQNELYRAGSEA